MNWTTSPAVARVLLMLLLNCLLCTLSWGDDRELAEEVSTTSTSAEEHSWKVGFNDRLLVETPLPPVKLEFGAFVQTDFAAFSGGDGFETPQGSLENSAEWRKAMFSVEGDLSTKVGFKFQYDFATKSPPQLKDAYLKFSNLHLPFELRVGRLKTPIGLEGYTSGRDSTYLERGLANAFLPSRNTGLVLLGTFPRRTVHWVFAFIQKEPDFRMPNFNRFGFSGRVARRFELGDDSFLHLGFDLEHRKVDDYIRFLERPESHLAPQFVDTGYIPANSADNWILESAFVRGPMTVEAELATSEVNGRGQVGQPDVRFPGYYVSASYLLTGEQRPYSEPEARFARLRPRHKLGDEGGLGAWEVGVRYSHLDLTDLNINGGVLTDVTGAVNWYLNDYSRIMFNVIRAERLDISTVWIYQTRLQLAF